MELVDIEEKRGKEKEAAMIIRVKSATFMCDQCPRRYSTQSALLRHQKSHDRSAWLSCEVCHLRFSRTDILQRHRQLHGDGNGQAERKRAIRACDGCRRNKIRCSGDNPCQACSKVGKRCTYLANMARPSVQSMQKEGKNAFQRKENPTESGDGVVFAPYEIVSTAAPISTAYYDANSNGQGKQDPVASELVTAAMTDSFNTALLAENPHLFTNIDRLLVEIPSYTAVTSKFGRNNEVPTVRYPQSSLGAAPGTPDFNLCEGFDHFIFPGVQIPYQIFNGKLPDPIQQTVLLPHNAVGDMVHQAIVDFLELGTKDAVFRSRKRRNFSQIIEGYFDLSSYMKDKTMHVLHTFLSSFFDNFSALWPITWHQGADHDTVEPLLYLTMTAIGAMHAESPNAAAYGLALHQELCAVLPKACLVCPEEQIKLEIIFEALLLSETMALYRGGLQVRGFVQEARTVLLAHAHRLSLFHELPAQASADPAVEFPRSLSEKGLQEWIRMERRRRMAFGFFRCEVFTALLFNTRPLIGFEDLRLKIPCDHEAWMYVGPEWRETLLLVAEEAVSYPLYCDIMRAATEGGNTSHPPLNGSADELILYGLQIQLLASFHDNDNAHRVIPELDNVYAANSCCANPSLQAFGVADGMALPKILHLIERWRATHDRFRLSNRPGSQVSSGAGLSPRLLYHMGYIRSNADLMALQAIASYNSNKEDNANSMADFAQDHLVLQQVHQWAMTDSARVALSHACEIWTLAEQHLTRSKKTKGRARLKYDQDMTIPSMISLYYAAIVIWVMAELSPDTHVRNIRQGVQQIGDVVAKASASSWQAASSLIKNTKALAYKGLCYT